MTEIYSTEIGFFGQRVIVSCDRQCNKAWGMLCRPQKQLDPDDIDDIVYFADSELGDAPTDPGTSEGFERKPANGRHNKWCVRQCERSTITDLGEPITLPDFSQRVYNMPEKHGLSV